MKKLIAIFILLTTITVFAKPLQYKEFKLGMSKKKVTSIIKSKYKKTFVAWGLIDHPNVIRIELTQFSGKPKTPKNNCIILVFDQKQRLFTLLVVTPYIEDVQYYAIYRQMQKKYKVKPEWSPKFNGMKDYRWNLYKGKKSQSVFLNMYEPKLKIKDTPNDVQSIQITYIDNVRSSKYNDYKYAKKNKY